MTISLQSIVTSYSRLSTSSIKSDASQNANHASSSQSVSTLGTEEDVFDISKLAYLKAGETEEEDGGLVDDRSAEEVRWSRQKEQAKLQLERLGKELKLVRKMYAHDPEEMAKQLVRLANMLKETVELYKEAQEELGKILKAQSGLSSMAMGGVSVGAVPAGGGATTPTESDETSVERDVNAAADDVELTESNDETVSSEASAEVDTGAEASNAQTADTDNTTAQAQSGLNAYNKQAFKTVRLDQTAFAMELRGDIEFAEGARNFVSKLRLDMSLAAKKSTNMSGDDEEKRKLFEKSDEHLEDIEKDMFKYVGDLQKAMPPGLRVQVPVDVSGAQPAMPAFTGMTV